MADYRRIVEEIQELLAMDAYPAANRLETLLGEHFEAIKEVNHRLRECDRLLQKGHRTEAIQRCEVEPNLLDVVNMLDFPERAEWAAYLKEIDLAAPPDLLVDVAADLNQAYVLEQPLTSLLRSHRLHALAGSPLRPRIELLRKIAQLDHNSSIWQEDLRDYETVRQRQLQGEVDAALHDRDVRSLALLEVEIRSPQWLASPPKALVERVVQVHAEVRAFCVRQELVALEPKLTAAYNALDVQAGRALREQWKARASVGITRQNDPLLELVAPSLDWLADEDRRDEDDASFNEAIVQLEQGLDGNAGREVLEKLYYNVTRFDREVPETLSQRLTERIRSLDSAARRRTTLTLTAIAATVLILGGMAAWFSYQMRQASIVQTHQATLEQLVAEGKLEQAEKHAEQLKAEEPAVYSDPDLGKVLGDLGDALATEANRKQLLDQGMASARALIEKKTPEAVQQARRDLKAIVLPLLKTDEEKLAQQELDRGAREIERGHQLERDKEFEQELNVLKGRLDKASSDDRDELEDLLRALNALSGQTGISPGVQSRVAPLLKKAQGMIESIALRSGEEKALQQITLRLDSRDRYLLALKEYVEKAPPQNVRAAEFDRVLKQDAEAWKLFEQWDLLAKRWAATRLADIDPAQAKALLMETELLLRSQGSFPGAEKVKELLPHLTAIAQRVDDSGNNIANVLNSVFDDKAIRDIPYMLKAKKIRYYTDKEPTFKGDQWTVHYFTDGTLSVRNKRDISDSEIANPKSGKSYVWQSPQKRFLDEAVLILDRLNQSNWDHTFCTLLFETTKHPDLDPFIQYQLAAKILEIGCQGSQCMQDGFRRERELIANANIDANANWISPDDADGDRARGAAETLLKRMAFLENGKKAISLQRELSKPVELPRYAWIGWVYRDASRKWTCSVRNAPATSEPLFVLEPKSPGEIVMTPIGQLTNGRPSVEPTSTEALVEGRPVFIATDK